MTRGRWVAPIGIIAVACVPGVLAEENAGVIVASVVAAFLLLCLFAGLTIYCLHKRGRDTKSSSGKRRKPKYIENGFHPPPPGYLENGFHPPPPGYYEKRANGHVPANGYATHKRPAPIPRAYMDQVPMAPVMIRPARPPLPPPQHYATYHGPPPEMRQYDQRAGTLSGPPPIVIPYGTMSIRPDPRPVVHKSRRKRSEERGDEETQRKSPKHRSPERRERRHKSQEFVIQQSYDGIPVIRPVVYIDDDDDRSRSKHRSKSRERRYKKRSEENTSGAKITEIKLDATELSAGHTGETVAEIETSRIRSRTISPTPSKAIHSAERSRASSVTEAVNQLRNSVKGHAGADDLDSDSSSSSNAPSFKWAHTHTHSEQRAPDPKAGDVMFFPAGTHVEPQRHVPEPDPPATHSAPEQDDPYVYTKVIKTSTRDRQDSPVQVEPQPSTSTHNHGYEVPISRSTKGTREEEITYETEHGRPTTDYSHIGASMSDRIQNLVEDGDKGRFSHYNVGAINFGDEDTGDELDPSQIRVRKRDSPPPDNPADHIYASAIKRPESPPNDIPLISPRESTEVPPLNLRSAVGSPRDQSLSYRPATPPKDFPITPQSSFHRPRPATPPTDFPMTPKEDTRPASPAFDSQITSRSVAVNPATGEPGSFQARQRLIEAHLLKNAGGGNSAPAPKPKTQTTTPAKQTPAPAPPVPTVHVTPGVIPPAPPPPPIKI